MDKTMVACQDWPAGHLSSGKKHGTDQRCEAPLSQAATVISYFAGRLATWRAARRPANTQSAMEVPLAK